MAKGAGGDRHQQGSVAALVLLRVFLGVLLLYNWAVQLGDMPAFTRSLEQATTVSGTLVNWSTWQPFTALLKHTVHPHAALFAWLFTAVGALAGIMLLLGVITRLGAGLAMLINLFFLLATWQSDTTAVGYNLALFVMALAVLIGAAGRTLGVDALIARRTKVKILW